MLNSEDSNVSDAVKERRESGDFPYALEKSGRKSLLLFDQYELVPKETFINEEGKYGISNGE
ncbi:hypothetical protein [Paenibacillus donghaensis]|uniref:Uncharacterized protein n=1 Tax=Paenibacillus donghaensis TaxID=414771 RepID=A0A2Z2KN15_9BACL|nr:hypothetical protein [Paenibacillus donghaensis]ASA25825.1 hypothetical protein B9T62_36910 [Paenibacillus donghaensis]